MENNKAWKIKKVVMAGFRNAVWELTEKPVGLWKMAKWGHLRLDKTPDLPQFPPLRDTVDMLCRDTGHKVEIFQDLFFPHALPTNLLDIPGTTYPTPLEDIPQTSPEEIQQAVFKLTPNKAPGPDSILFRIL